MQSSKEWLLLVSSILFNEAAPQATENAEPLPTTLLRTADTATMSVQDLR